jgi:hypothetical protein
MADDKLFGTQPPKTAVEYTALKSCKVRYKDALIRLVEGEPISGLTAQEANYLKRFGYIKANSTSRPKKDEGREKK